MERLRFSYYSDPLCIWAFVAQSKLEQILEEWGDRLEVDYRIVPVFGSVPERFSKGAWAAVGPEGRRDATKKVALSHTREDVDGRVWIDDPPASSLSSGAAAAAVFALEADELAAKGTGARYQWALRERFFVDNENIARRSVQLSVAESVGVDVVALEGKLDDGSALARLFEDDESRKKLGVRGSPTYIFDGGRAMLYGNFSFAILHATVEELVKGMGVGASAC